MAAIVSRGGVWSSGCSSCSFSATCKVSRQREFTGGRVQFFGNGARSVVSNLVLDQRNENRGVVFFFDPTKLF
jgi:hypothetical protein